MGHQHSPSHQHSPNINPSEKMAALTSSCVAPVMALSSRTNASAKFQARKAPVAKRVSVVTQAMAKKDAAPKFDFMQWFDTMMVKDSVALGAGVETDIKTDSFAKSGTKTATKKKFGKK